MIKGALISKPVITTHTSRGRKYDKSSFQDCTIAQVVNTLKYEQKENYKRVSLWNMDMWKYHENHLERPWKSFHGLWILQNEISCPQLRPWNFSWKKKQGFFFMAQFNGQAFSWVMNFPLKHPSQLSCHESWLTKSLIKFSWVMKCISSIWSMGHENDTCPMGHEFPMKLWGEKPVSYTHLTLPTKLEV